MITVRSTSFGTKPIPLHEPHLAGNEWRYVRDCLDTGWVSSVGTYVDRFEAELAKRCWVQHGVATSSGTAALHVALLVAGVEAEDEVLVSTLSFIAPANAIRYVGAHPVFIDADPKYWQMDVSRLEEFLRTRCTLSDGALVNRATGRRVRAILPVHVMGHPVDLDAIYEIARHYGLVVLEDAAEGMGADYKGRPVGRTDSIAITSFNGNKIITAGGGGMILTDRTDWAERARYLTTQAKDDAVEYIHGAIGFNYRLTNIQAALGLAQLEQIEEFVNHKRTIACRYEEGLADMVGLRPMPQAEWARSTYWLYSLLIDERHFGRNSREVIEALQALGIQARPLWQPLHLSKPHRRSERVGGEVAERIFTQAISLPSSVGLALETVDEVVAALRRLGR